MSVRLHLLFSFLCLISFVFAARHAYEKICLYQSWHHSEYVREIGGEQVEVITVFFHLLP